MVRFGGILFIVNLIAGLYFLNLGFNFFAIPESLSMLDKWMNIIGGVLLIVGGFFSMRAVSKLRKKL
jgi:uncharacterized membrane protein